MRKMRKKKKTAKYDIDFWCENTVSDYTDLYNLIKTK